MTPVWLLVALFTSNGPSALPLALAAPDAVYTVDGPTFGIPVHFGPVRALDPVPDRVRLFVSTDRGATWTAGPFKKVDGAEERELLMYQAARAGEHWFAVQLEYPLRFWEHNRPGEMRPQLKVHIRTAVALAPPPRVKGADLLDLAAELDEEMTRVELDLIRRDLRSLAEARPGTVGAGLASEQIEPLRKRLDKVRERLRPAPLTSPTEVTLPPLRDPSK